MLGLSNAVRAYRWNQLHEFMHAAGLDALAFTDGPWFEWVANLEMFDLSWERPYVLIFPADGKPFAIASAQSRFAFHFARERRISWLDSMEFYVETPQRNGGHWTADEWEAMVVEFVSSAGLSSGRMAVDSINSGLVIAAKSLPDLSISAAGPALRALRWIKHPEEIAMMEVGAQLSDWAMEQYEPLLDPGILLSELDYTIAGRLSARAAESFGGENFRITGISTLSGPSSASPKGDCAATGRRLEKDAVAMTTIATRFNGMAVELARTWLVGRPPSDIMTLHRCAQDASRAAVGAAIAGRPVSGIQAAAQDVFARAGIAEHFMLRGGHGIGVTLHDYPENLAFENRPLQTQETYAVEPSLFVAGVGAFRFADTIVVGDDSARMLTHSIRSP